MSQFLSKLLYLTKGHHKALMVMIATFLFISALEVLGTGIVGPFIAVATYPDLIRSNSWLTLVYKTLNCSSDQQFLIILGGIVITAFYAKAFLGFLAQKEVFRFGYTLKGDLSCKLMRAYLAAPYSFHLNINSATLIQDILSTTDNVCLGVVMNILTSTSNLLITIALMTLLVKTNILALVLILMMGIVMFGLLKVLKKPLTHWSKEGWEASGAMIQILNHGLGGLKETRVIGCESYFNRQMEQQTVKFATNLTLTQGYGNLPRYAIEAFMLTFLVGFTLLFVSLNQKDQNLSGVLGVFALASIRLLPASGNLISGLNIVRANTFAVDKLFFDLKNLEKENADINDHEKSNKISSRLFGAKGAVIPFEEQITLEKVTFQYPNTNLKALNDVSLTIQKGQSIGIIGKSGSGKTTLVDVVLGLFKPQSGDIKVDGVSVYRDLRAWQNLLGYVPQSIFLIDDTLERNIAFGVPDHAIDPDRLKNAIEMAQLSDVVDRLPNGIHTMVGERGVLLSGGQRQRVGIARVLYHEREILVFDEATAALDNETEHLVTEATKALSGNNTIIIIAHRLSTIEHCDRIYQIEQGEVIKSGSYQEVVLGK
jgi:ATP-binding cassette, subfamily B, bacterial PglK